ncbi:MULTISPECIES: hypothetical protein [unclassified Motilimonas]|uniref:hypothetical protein n=1 Tax=Motilimonas TaxID=1914248 RepID=UPI001E2ADB72|nr:MULTISPECIES: hypothetical protein [unclassified Motilimonas]MCE0558904.1 hypothetical protein [Motilimonas sp. E26]MDO6527048.1 hypothetical protein [Motilimonas sp. 1_MG-2023]
MASQGSTGNVIAAVCSFFICGLGQLVQGRILAALMFCLFTYAAYGIAGFTFGIFLIIAVPLHIWCIVDAALYRGD